MWLWVAAAQAAKVVVVVSPGVAVEAYTDLIREIRDAGHDVSAEHVSCATTGFDAAARSLHRRLVGHSDHVLVAHGFGASVALRAHAPTSRRYVLLAPVLDIWPVSAMRSVRLTADWPELQPLLGTPLAADCFSASLARDLEDWLQTGEVPTSHLSSIAEPVWLAVSAGDNLAGVEAVIPASRELPERTVIRLGKKRLDPIDFDHGQMLTHPIPIKAVVKALE
jgi:hypothetical protein